MQKLSQGRWLLGGAAGWLRRPRANIKLPPALGLERWGALPVAPKSLIHCINSAALASKGVTSSSIAIITFRVHLRAFGVCNGGKDLGVLRIHMLPAQRNYGNRPSAPILYVWSTWMLRSPLLSPLQWLIAPSHHWLHIQLFPHQLVQHSAPNAVSATPAGRPAPSIHILAWALGGANGGVLKR